MDINRTRIPFPLEGNSLACLFGQEYRRCPPPGSPELWVWSHPWFRKAWARARHQREQYSRGRQVESGSG